MKYWIYAFMLVAQTAVAQVTPGEGNDGPHGGFAYGYAQERLRVAAAGLSVQANRISDGILDRYRVNRAHIREAIQPGAVRELPNTERNRGGSPLELDYRRRPRCEVSVLRPFFVLYEARRTESHATIEREIQEKLLHEAAHCSGVGETAARQFAHDAMAEISPQVDAASWRRLRLGRYAPFSRSTDQQDDAFYDIEFVVTRLDRRFFRYLNGYYDAGHVDLTSLDVAGVEELRASDGRLVEVRGDMEFVFGGVRYQWASRE